MLDIKCLINYELLKNFSDGIFSDRMNRIPLAVFIDDDGGRLYCYMPPFSNCLVII